MRTTLHIISFVALTFISCTISQAQIISNFDTSTEGWTIADINNLNPQTVNYSSSGGNPGGYASVTYGTNQASFWTAPAKFLGEHCLSSYGLNLKFDLEFSGTTGYVHASTVGDVILYNNTTAIVLNLPSFPTSGTWASYAIKLDTSAPWHNGSVTGSLSTSNDILNVLQNLTMIRINGQYKFATGTISNIDNVILETTPLGTPPTITSFSPKTGLPNTPITITGNNFNPTASNNLVYFGGVKTIPTSATATQLVVKVPLGALCTPITVINLTTGLEASTADSFRPLFDNNKDYGGQIIRATMAPFVSFALEDYHGKSEAADIDGDGLNDIVVAESGLKKFSVLRNNGVTGNITASSFTAKVSFSMINPGKGYMAIADFDGDGRLDVVLSAADAFQSYIAVFRNTSTPGSISFGAPSYYNALSYSDGPLTVADMDGDGRPEIIGVFNNNCGSSNRVYIFPNRSTIGNIEFCYYLAFGPVYTCGGFVTVGDLNGDKLPDVVVTSASGSSIATVLPNTSTPGVLSMSTPFTLTTTNLYGRAVIADLDNDGKNDVGWAYYPSSLEVRKNNYSSGVFDATSFSSGFVFPGSESLSSANSELVAGDINGDGKVDLAVNGSSNISIWQNVSNAGSLDASSFLTGVPYFISTSTFTPESPRLADFDGDNKPDLLVKLSSSAAPVVAIFHNESFPAPRIDSFSPSAVSIGNTLTVTGDYFLTGTLPTMSGRLGPIATATITPSSNTSATVTVPANSFSNRLSVTERGLTGFSKRVDVVFGTSHVIGSTTFPASIDFPLGNNLRDALEIADFDDDGKVDVITVDNFSVTKIFQNTHATAGQPITSSSLTVQATTYTSGYNIVALDIDGDGKTDLNNGYGLLKNNSTTGSISFLYGPNGAYTTASGFTGVAANDFNKDGKVDLAVTTGGASVQLFENRSTKEPFMYNSQYSTFSLTPVALAKPGSNGVVASADFDNDGYDDLVATTNATNNFTFYRNLGTYGPISAASFSAGTNVTTGTTPYGITANDFDGDGKIDVAVTHFNALFVSVYLNTSTTGTISFAAPVTFTTLNKGYNIDSQDLDGDGKAEIVVIHQLNPSPGSFTVLQNKSSIGTLSFTATNYPITRNPQQLKLADINADQKPDILIVANSGTIGNALMIFENKITSPVLTITTQPRDTAVCVTSPASFKVNAAGTTNITYQWQYATASTAPYNDLSDGGGYAGTASNILLINTTGNFGAGSYRCRVGGDLVTPVLTGNASLVINAAPTAPTTTGDSECAGSTFTLHGAGGTDGQYRWYADLTSSPIAGAVNGAYVTPPLSITTVFYTSINNGLCESSRIPVTATTESVPLAPGPGDLSSCVPSTLTIHAFGGTNGAYRWYTQPTGTGSVIAGEVNSSYVTPFLATTTTYYVSLINGSCESSRTPVTAGITAIQKPMLSLTPAVASNTVNLCIGQSEIIQAPQGFAVYTWSNGEATTQITVTQSGIYSVTVTDGAGCVSPFSDPITINTIQSPTALITAEDGALVSSSGDSYQWFSAGKILDGATSQSLAISLLEYGTYAVDVTTNGCTSHSKDFEYLITATEPWLKGLKIYPNPVRNELMIDTPAKNICILIDATDRIINVPAFETSSGKKLVLNDVEPGIYFLIIQSETSKTHFKILKQE